MALIKALVLYPGVFYRSLRDLTERERLYLTSEIMQVRGLMPLLMKPRNRQRWTPEEKQALVAHFRRLTSISSYLVVLVMPGGMLMLPALSWWLDRRRNRRSSGPAMQG
jgi:hypothetical protein